jgi:hypothetical protein
VHGAVNYEVYKGDERHDVEQDKDYRRNWEIDKVLGSSSLRGPSRIDLGWNDFAIEWLKGNIDQT